MGLSEELQEELDNMDARYAAVVRRLGEWQALAVDFLECRNSEDGLAKCLAEAATMLRRDLCPESYAPSRSEALADAVELNARMRQEVADMDAQRAAAVLEATELRDALAPWQERVQHLEAVRTELLAQRDGGDVLLRERTTEVMRLVQANERLHEEAKTLREEVEALRKVGGWAEGTVAVDAEAEASPYENEIREVIERFPHNQAQPTPEPDQNHTETIPTPKKNRLSEAARQKASANMKAMQARKAAEKRQQEREVGLSMAQIAAKRAIFDRVWRAEPLPLDKEFLRHTMGLHGVTRAELTAAVRTFTPGDMARSVDALEFYRACMEETESEVAAEVAA